MALGGVFMSDTDGNIGTSSTTSTEKVTGLLFDISKQAKFFEEGAGLAVKTNYKVMLLKSILWMI